MVDTVRPPHDPEPTPDLNISLRGRVYPLTCRRALPPPDIPPDADQPAQELQNRIMSMMLFPGRHPESFSGSTEIVRAFCSDMVLLESMAHQWRRFLKNLRKANISAVFATNVSKRQQQRALDQALQVMGHESEAMVNDGGVLNGDLVEQTPLHVFQTLRAALQTAIIRFTSVMQSDLEQLSDLRVVGLLEWCGESTCRFHFYEHRVTSVVDHRTTDQQSVPMTRHGKTRLGVEVFEELAGRHIHSVTRRAELLIEAKSCSASDPHLVLPQAIRDCIHHCPVWLRPELEVVEGEKVREEWVELVRIERQWQERWCRQRIQPHFDPALTIFGQFVLMGWDEKAHQEEIHSRIRLSSDQLEQSPPPDVPEHPDRHLTPMIAWIVAVVFGMLMLLAAGGISGHVSATLLPLTCLPTTYQFLTGGGRISNVNEIKTSSFLASQSMMFAVLAAGYFLAACVVGQPVYFVIALYGIIMAVSFGIYSRKGGVA